MGVFDRQIASTRRQLARYGQAVTWRQFTQGEAEDATKPWILPDPTENDYSVSILFIPRSEALRYMKEAAVPKGDFIAYMGAVDFTPKMGDLVIRNATTTLRVDSIEELAPNGEAILYTMGLML